MEYQVIDNFLPDSEFQEIKKFLLGNDFAWYYGDSVSLLGNDDPKLYYFTHTFFSEHLVRSQQIKVLNPLIQKINPIAISRIKANLYPNINEHIAHGMHRDLEVPHKGAVFYVNTNNGFTILEDGTKIESIENRILFFNSYKLHCSTTCTDAKTRITVNFNYF